jgi:hypothetical protein
VVGPLGPPSFEVCRKDTARTGVARFGSLAPYFLPEVNSPLQEGIQMKWQDFKLRAEKLHVGVRAQAVDLSLAGVKPSEIRAAAQLVLDAVEGLNDLDEILPSEECPCERGLPCTEHGATV